MRKVLLLISIFFVLSLSSVYADCVVPTDGMVITEDTTFCYGVYHLPSGIKIGANDIELNCNGATLNGTGFYGIFLQDKNNATVKNCKIGYYEWGGIHLKNSSHNILINNEIYWEYGQPYGQSSYAIRLEEESDYNTISNNKLHDYYYEAILVTNSNNNIFSDNIIFYICVYGIRFTQSNNNTISNNNFSGIGCSFWDSSYIRLWNSNFNKIIANNMSATHGYGIFSANSSYNEISQNRIINFAWPIYQIYSSDFNKISDNAISGIYGITISSSYLGYYGKEIIQSNIILNNNITDGQEAITLLNASNITVAFNNIYNNRNGIYISNTEPSSISHKISFNNIYNNSEYNFYNNQPNQVEAKNNWWGTTNCSLINEKITDIVIFEPFLNAPYPFGVSVSCGDIDNDSVPNIDDKCPNTIGEQLVYGCSCEQILNLKPGEDSVECSKGIIEVFTKAIGWAKDLFG